MTVLKFIVYYLDVIFSTLGVVVLLGLLSYLVERLYMLLVGRAFGRGSILISAVIGTPVHEIGHAVMCLIFGHKITELKLFSPRAEDGTLGHVKHSYRKRNIYHQIGNLFIGLGPIFSGAFIVSLVMLICFRGAWFDYRGSAAGALFGSEDIFGAVLGALKMPVNMILCEGRWWVKLIGIFVMLAVTMHITLSPADIKSSWAGFIFYAVISLIFAIITSLFGLGTVGAIRNGLHTFALFNFALFSVIFVCQAIIILASLAVYLIRLLIKTIFKK